jgi:phytoene dehydrogenase-like protein
VTGWDAIVIGAGHNGLAAAHVLAEAGRRVLVMEKADQIGGMAAAIELAPGVRAPRFAHLFRGPSPYLPGSPSLPTVSMAPDGHHVAITADSVRFADGSAHPDEAAYLVLRRRLMRFAGVLAPMMQAPPPMLTGGGWRQTEQLGRLLLRLRRLGKPEMRTFLQVALGNVSDVIGDEIPDGPLAGAMSLDAVLGARAGPRSPGTVLGLLYRYAQGGEHRLPIGGMGALSEAMAASARRAGAQMRTAAPVEAVLVEEDRAVGVRLAHGEEIRAGWVLSSLDVRTTMQLAGVAHFDVEAVRRVRNVRSRGVTGKLNLALAEPPRFLGLPDSLLRSRIVLAPSMAQVEHAFDAVKYEGCSDRPVIELVVPSLFGPPGPGPAGHVLSAIVQYVPRTGEAAAETALAALEELAPGLRRSIFYQEFLAPVDIERITGIAGGHWHHAEMAPDQLLMNRPVTGMGSYATGLPGLSLCGAGSHPGGDVTGAPGRNAAAALLRGEGA